MGGFPWRRKIMSEHQRVEGKPNWNGESGTPPNPEALEVGGERATSPTGKANPKPYLNEPKEPPPQQSTTI